VAAAVPRVEGGQPFAVESGDQMGDRVAALAAGGPGRLPVVGTTGDGQGHDGPGDANGRCGGGAAQAGQVLTLVIGQGAERILPAAGHGNSWGRQLHPG
jgi:hypothetical protein